MIQDVRSGHSAPRTVDANDYGFDLVVLCGPRQLFLECGQHVGLRNDAFLILRADDPREIEQQDFSIARASELYFLHRPRGLDEIDRHATGLQHHGCKEAEPPKYWVHAIHTVSPTIA